MQQLEVVVSSEKDVTETLIQKVTQFTGILTETKKTLGTCSVSPPCLCAVLDSYAELISGSSERQQSSAESATLDRIEQNTSRSANFLKTSSQQVVLMLSSVHDVSCHNRAMITDALSAIDSFSTQLANLESRVIELSHSTPLTCSDEALPRSTLLSELRRSYEPESVSLTPSDSPINLVSFQVPRLRTSHSSSTLACGVKSMYFPS